MDGGNEEVRARHFSVVPRTRGNGHKLERVKCHLNIRKNFLAGRMIKHCHGLPREVVKSPSVQILRTSLDMDLDNLM